MRMHKTQVPQGLQDHQGRRARRDLAERFQMRAAR